MNKQEIFNTVAAHLLTQRQRSAVLVANSSGLLTSKCMYHGDNGMKCAIGVLIKDEHYNKKLEHNLVKSNPVLLALKASGVELSSETLRMMQHLQSVHDGGYPARWKSELSYVARDFGLDASVLNQFKDEQ